MGERKIKKLHCRGGSSSGSCGGGGGSGGVVWGWRWLGVQSTSYDAVIIHKIREVIPRVVFVPQLDVHLVLTLLAEIQEPDLFAEIGLGRHPMVHSARRTPPTTITSGNTAPFKVNESRGRSCG